MSSGGLDLVNSEEYRRIQSILSLGVLLLIVLPVIAVVIGVQLLRILLLDLLDGLL